MSYLGGPKKKNCTSKFFLSSTTSGNIHHSFLFFVSEMLKCYHSILNSLLPFKTWTGLCSIFWKTFESSSDTKKQRNWYQRFKNCLRGEARVETPIRQSLLCCVLSKLTAIHLNLQCALLVIASMLTDQNIQQRLLIAE